MWLFGLYGVKSVIGAFCRSFYLNRPRSIAEYHDRKNQMESIDHWIFISRSYFSIDEVCYLNSYLGWYWSIIEFWYRIQISRSYYLIAKVCYLNSYLGWHWSISEFLIRICFDRSKPNLWILLLTDPNQIEFCSRLIEFELIDHWIWFISIRLVLSALRHTDIGLLFLIVLGDTAFVQM